jgi:hypothetical protein
LNGEAFRGLYKLSLISLSGNVCIDEFFEVSTRIAVLQQTVNEKCHFEETKTSATTTAPTVYEDSITQSNAAIAKLQAESDAIEFS